MDKDRREFLAQAARATVVGAGVATGILNLGMLSGCASPAKRSGGLGPPVIDALEGAEPVAPLPALPLARVFTGDVSPTRAHEALWTKQAYLAQRGGLPEPTERAGVVIVGGGLSGLSTAWMLRDRDPVLLEQAARFGGNARGESWEGIPFSIGAAYFGKAEESEPTMKLMAEVGLMGKWREDHPIEDRLLLLGGKGKNRIFPKFWFGGSDPSHAADFQAAWKYFERVRDTAYPDPCDIAAPGAGGETLTRAQLNELDKRSFEEEIARNLGKHYHPHLRELVTHYAWSTFAAEADEISAVSGLYNLASDLGGIYTFPGGNSFVTQAFFKALHSKLASGKMKREVVVLDVRTSAEGVRVSYVTPEGAVRTIAAKACVVAAPKFVAKKLIDDMPKAQRDAMAAMEYRSYLLTNVLLNHKVPDNFYDQYLMLGSKPKRSRSELDRMPFTDATLATFATRGHPDRAVLGLYRGLPYKDARADLLGEGAYDRARAQVERKLPELLEGLSIPESAVADIRVARWGHPMPLHRPGMIASGLLERAAAPIGDRIFFAHQDNWANPCLESVLSVTIELAEKLKTLV